MTPEPKSVSEPAASVAAPSAEAGDPARQTEPQVVTSPEELEGFHIVRAILRGLVPTKRVVMRDAQTYCAILLDDNNRKPICRLRFNNRTKLRLGLFNDKKEEEIVAIETPDDIYNYAAQLNSVVALYLPQADS
jgi:hypothetical protein